MVAWIMLFGVGVGVAVAWTEVVKAVQDRRPVAAGAWTVILDLVTVGLTWWVIQADSVPGLVAYAVGGGLGTALTVLRPKRRPGAGGGRKDR